MRLVDVFELAAQLALAPKTIYRLAQDGTIPSMRIGRIWRFDPEEVARALRGRRFEPPDGDLIERRGAR